MDKKPVFIICPRCELNYIQQKDKYCQICKAEMGLVDPSILIADIEDEEVEGKLCPVCKTNYCEEGEDICIVCRKERTAREKSSEPDSWDEADTLTAEIEDENIEVSLTQLEEEEEADEEMEEEGGAGDDFEYINTDDVEDYEEDEGEEEDDEF